MTTTTIMTEFLLTEDNSNYILCEDCELELAERIFVRVDRKTFKLCKKCHLEACVACMEQREAEAAEEEEERECQEYEERQDDLGQCVSCRKEKATIVFMHLKNGNFELCERCFRWADHDDDYGIEFKKEKSLLDTLVWFLRG
jgi:hypothetical protein